MIIISIVIWFSDGIKWYTADLVIFHPGFRVAGFHPGEEQRQTVRFQAPFVVRKVAVTAEAIWSGSSRLELLHILWYMMYP